MTGKRRWQITLYCACGSTQACNCSVSGVVGTCENFLEEALELVRPERVNDWVKSAVDDNHHHNGRAECVGDSTGTKFGRDQDTDKCWDIAEGKCANHHCCKNNKCENCTR